MRPRRDHRRGLSHVSVVTMSSIQWSPKRNTLMRRQWLSRGRLLRTVGMAGHRSRRLRLIGTSVVALLNSGNMHDEVPSTVVPGFPSTIPASATVLREVHPSPCGRYTVLSDKVDSEPENRVDPTVLDSVEGVVDHRRMPDTDSDSTESVCILLMRCCRTWKHFGEEIDVEEVEVPLPRWPRRMFVDGLRSVGGVDIRQIFRRRALVMKSVPKFPWTSFIRVSSTQGAYMCVRVLFPPKHQMRLYVCHQMRLYVCHQMCLPSPQRSSLRSLTFGRFARTFFQLG